MYTVLLPPGRYTIRDDCGYPLISGQREVTVEIGGTSRLDLIFGFT